MYLTYQQKIDPHWAWETYQPSDKCPWTLEKAGHLFRRAAWGATKNDLQQAVKEGVEVTISRLIETPGDYASFEHKMERLAVPLAEGADENRLRAWWLYVMLNSPHPLHERMTLFWHNHFATSNAKVQDVGYMYRQNQLLRKHALGQFGPMLHAISEDPAMLIWLDTVSNKKGTPNENYARELMELFSLGLGNYTEQDIRQAARAFTGWGIRKGQFYFAEHEHDAGEKTVFGKTAHFTGHQIVDLCLEKDACAQFLVKKLFRYFMSETLIPNDQLIAPLASQFRRSHYDIRKLVGTILRSNLFFSNDVYRTRVKSPVEFAIGLIRQLEGRADSIQLADLLDPLGQRLFAPPSVKGWDGGPNWLNSTTLLLRHNLCLAVTSTEDRRFYNRCDPARLLAKYDAGKSKALDGAVQFLCELFLQGDISPETRARLRERMKQLETQQYAGYWSKEFIFEYQTRALCHLVLTLPEYQLA